MEQCDNIKPHREKPRELNRLGVEIMNGSIVSFYCFCAEPFLLSFGPGQVGLW